MTILSPRLALNLNYLMSCCIAFCCAARAKPCHTTPPLSCHTTVSHLALRFSCSLVAPPSLLHQLFVECHLSPHIAASLYHAYHALRCSLNVVVAASASTSTTTLLSMWWLDHWWSLWTPAHCDHASIYFVENRRADVCSLFCSMRRHRKEGTRQLWRIRCLCESNSWWYDGKGLLELSIGWRTTMQKILYFLVGGRAKAEARYLFIGETSLRLSEYLSLRNLRWEFAR